jgi:predicted nucleic acid-binding protein
MIVIADTSPLSYLIRIEQIEVLPRLYERIVIPAMVFGELSHSRAPDAVRDWIARPPQWLEIRTPQQRPDAELMSAGLDAGERDAILMALELEADELIIDDLDGRREAQRLGLHFVGTLGVLRLAADKGLLDFKNAVERLRGVNFYVAQDVLRLFLKDEAE